MKDIDKLDITIGVMCWAMMIGIMVYEVYCYYNP